MSSYTHCTHAAGWLARVEGSKSKSTHDKREVDIRKFQEWADGENIDVLDISPFVLEGYFVDMNRRGYAPTSISTRWSSVQQFYKYLTKAGVIDESPFEEIEYDEHRRILEGTRKEKETKSQITYLSPDEINTLCDHLPNPADRNELLIRLMFQTGLRRGEVEDVDIEDIDRDKRSIRVYAEKTHKNREVYYQPSLDTLLDLWIDGGGRDRYLVASESDALFISRKQPRIRGETINQIVLLAASEAGIQEGLYIDKNGRQRWKYTAHSLRHSHAVESIKSGIDIERVRRHMGHSSLDQTMKYLRFVQEDTWRSYQKFGARDQG